jgi:hypothetical protein
MPSHAFNLARRKKEFCDCRHAPRGVGALKSPDVVAVASAWGDLRGASRFCHDAWLSLAFVGAGLALLHHCALDAAGRYLMTAPTMIQASVAMTLYALRKQTPEPVFGIIKSVMGFRQFLRAGPGTSSGYMRSASAERFRYSFRSRPGVWNLPPAAIRIA